MITKRVQYRYDSVRNKIGMTDADGGLHTYTYDVMRRLTGVINPLGERTTYAYDLNGRRTSVQLANGTRTSYVYDLGSRVQSVHTLKSDDSTVSKFEYEYDGNGRRTSVLEADGSRVTWTYDRISQVTSEWRTGTNPYRHTFTYDSVGNRTLKIEDGARTTLVYDACNQLVTSEDIGGITSYVYDGNGNQTVIQKPNGDRTTQMWDYENRLVKTIQPSGGVTSMAYDADGLRLKKEDATGTKLFVWDDQNYQAETDAAGATETAFTTEPSTYGGLISHRKAGASTTYHFDALGSTRALTDASETVLGRYNYSAFGTLLGSPTLHTPFLWGGMVGYYWDAALATQYIRARHYQPAIARWISLDPIGFAGGDANLFRYVGNSPTSGGTARRVRLTAAAFGQWQLTIAPTTLAFLSLTGMYERSQRRFLDFNQIRYQAGIPLYIWHMTPRGVDPSGMEDVIKTNARITDKKLRFWDPDESSAGVKGQTHWFYGNPGILEGLDEFLTNPGVFKHDKCDECSDCRTLVDRWTNGTRLLTVSVQVGERPNIKRKRCNILFSCSPKCIFDGAVGTTSTYTEQLSYICLRCGDNSGTPLESIFSHEVQHAVDNCLLGKSDGSCEDCMARERRAYTRDASITYKSNDPQLSAYIERGILASCQVKCDGTDNKEYDSLKSLHSIYD